MIRDGALDGMRSRRRLRRPDGSAVDVQMTGWAIRSTYAPDLGLWFVDDASSGELAYRSDSDAASSWSPERTVHDGAQLILDDRWRVAHAGPTTGWLFGRQSADLVGSSLLDLAHPADLPAMLLAFARATCEVTAVVRVRVRQHDGGWRSIRTVLAARRADPSFPFSLAAAAPGGEWDSEDDVAQIAGHLRRIASQIETAGALAPLMQTVETMAIPDGTELSGRQWEIAKRLVRGQRVATIADELFLSRSTVRNHLSAIFRRFGVHSQAELLGLWQGGSEGPRRLERTRFTSSVPPEPGGTTDTRP
jgi:DNA-binding CsgD family transcriptional regulator